MKPPFCEYEVLSHEWKFADGKPRWDAVAMLKDCGHSHWYGDFNARLKRFNDRLNLGFDLRKGRWCIYIWEPEPVALGRLDGIKIGHVFRHLNIILDMKWLVNRRQKDGGLRPEFIARPPGEWVFTRLKEYKKAQLDGSSTWIGDALRETYDANKAADRAEAHAKIEDMVSDAMTLADRGNPAVRKTAVRVSEKPPEMVGAK